MLGKFTFFVANTPPTESISICDASVIGTAYVRDEPLIETFEVTQESSATFSVPHVHAADIIGNVLDIDLRLSEDSDFTFVQFTNAAGATGVLIDATGLAVGTYTLKLESIDRNSETLSTLKIDTITITVLELELELEPEPEPEIDLATFLSPVKNVAIVSGVE